MEEIDYRERLTELFYNTLSDQKIREIIDVVLEEHNGLTAEEKLEAMVNLLIDSNNVNYAENEEGAAGLTKACQNLYVNENLQRLLDIFPDMCPNFLTEFCQKYDEFDFDLILDDLTRTDYVKIDKDPMDVWEQLKAMLPGADPIYLRNQARVLVNRPKEELQQFVENAVQKNDYPSMKDYLINKELTTELALYTTKFSVVEYLKRVPNPIELYLNSERESILSRDAAESDIEFALAFLNNQFLYQRQKEIKKIFSHYDNHLIKSYNKLKILPKAFRNKREPEDDKDCSNVELLKEVAFLKNEKVIRRFIKQKDERYRSAFEQAKLEGLLQSCACCYDDQLIPEECYFCNKSCIFCKDCVKTGAEHVIGKEETVFPCLNDCDSEFSYSTLQMVLDTKTFRAVCHRKQLEEIRNANIDGLESCPHCDFCMIPNENDKIFKCGNFECMKETCRLCQHPAHVPLRCEEIEYDEDVKMRTFIENKMTEALLRKCWNCSKQFYKDSGCNKMTCVCGAKMCYLCGAAVRDYEHFRQPEGCALHTENLQLLHLNRVKEGAAAAKTELGITSNPRVLKFDPTRNIENQVH